MDFLAVGSFVSLVSCRLFSFPRVLHSRVIYVDCLSKNRQHIGGSGNPFFKSLLDKQFTWPPYMRDLSWPSPLFPYDYIHNLPSIWDMTPSTTLTIHISMRNGCHQISSLKQHLQKNKKWHKISSRNSNVFLPIRQNLAAYELCQAPYYQHLFKS